MEVGRDECSVRKRAFFVLLDDGSGPINGGYSDYRQSPAHRTRTLFSAMYVRGPRKQGGGERAWVCFVGVWSSRLRPQGYELHVLAPAACTACHSAIFFPVERHRALH